VPSYFEFTQQTTKYLRVLAKYIVLGSTMLLLKNYSGEISKVVINVA
jgi:hypothetical protein